MIVTHNFLENRLKHTSSSSPPCRMYQCMVVFEAPAGNEESSSKESKLLPAGHLFDKKS